MWIKLEREGHAGDALCHICPMSGSTAILCLATDPSHGVERSTGMRACSNKEMRLDHYALLSMPNSPLPVYSAQSQYLVKS